MLKIKKRLFKFKKNLFDQIQRNIYILSANKRRTPNFIIIGVQKGGTTSLFSYLEQHPDVILSNRKEVHFFNNNYHKGINWYKSFFPRVNKENFSITGEASPCYIYHPLAALRIKNDFPNVKIIALLRNPIQRAYSHYQHCRRRGIEDIETFEEALSVENKRIPVDELERIKNEPNYYSYNHQKFSYSSRGKYYAQLKPWFDLFPKENLLIIKSEDLFSSPKDQLKLVYNFLNIEENYPENLTAKNTGTYLPINEEAKKKLIEYYKEDSNQLKRLLGDNFFWEY